MNEIRVLNDDELGRVSAAPHVTPADTDARQMEHEDWLDGVSAENDTHAKERHPAIDFLLILGLAICATVLGYLMVVSVML